MNSLQLGVFCSPAIMVSVLAHAPFHRPPNSSYARGTEKIYVLFLTD